MRNSLMDMASSTFSQIVAYWKRCMIKFDPHELPSRYIIEQILALYINVNLYGMQTKRALVETGSGLQICSSSFLDKLKYKNFPPIEKSNMKIKSFDNMEKQRIGMITLPIQLRSKTVESPCYIMQWELSCDLLVVSRK